MSKEKLPSCCSYRGILVSQQRQDLRGYVRKKSGNRVLTESEQVKLNDLKDALARQIRCFEEHIHDETLEHK